MFIHNLKRRKKMQPQSEKNTENQQGQVRNPGKSAPGTVENQNKTKFNPQDPQGQEPVAGQKPGQGNRSSTSGNPNVQTQQGSQRQGSSQSSQGSSQSSQ